MPASLNQVAVDFEHFLVEKGLRLTGPRRLIVEVALGLEGHFTSEDLLAKVARKNSAVSRATVYRTVKLLADAGALKAVDTGKGSVAYVSHFSRRSSLAEIVCMDCGRIEMIEAPFMDWYGRAAAAKCGLEAVEGKLQIKGHCLRAKTGKCPNKKG